MQPLRLSLMCFAACLGGCDTVRGIRANADYPAKIDTECVDETLRVAFDKVERWNYVHGGGAGTFPKGTSVAEFAYYSTPDRQQVATLSIGHTDAGTRVSHAFTGVGAKLPEAVFPPALAAMRRAGDAVRASCGLDLSNMRMREIGQNVEALDS